MSITFFCVGAVIFAIYMYFTIWNIYNSQPKSKRKDYSNLGGEGCDLPENVQAEVQKPEPVHNLEDELEDEEDFYSL